MNAPLSAALPLAQGPDAEEALWLMAYEKPSFGSLRTLDRAGEGIRRISSGSDVIEEADAVLTMQNWRASHAYPLTAFHRHLRLRAKSIDPRAITSQRLKRFESIERKLVRYPSMKMSEMQDVGGCRAVVSSLKDLRALQALYTQEGGHGRHKAFRPKDYVTSPKPDGYRGVHLIYGFVGDGYSAPWSRLKIEIQLRTYRQHSWSTAVEVIDAFTGQDLKFGGGLPGWKRFFVLAGRLIALDHQAFSTLEESKAFAKELDDIERSLGAIHQLRMFPLLSLGIDHHPHHPGPNGWWVLTLFLNAPAIRTEPYPLQEFAAAKRRYSEVEQEIRASGNRELAVLASAESLSELKEAYPNFFIDVQAFTDLVAGFLGRDVGPRAIPSSALGSPR